MTTMNRTPNNATITVSPAEHARAPRSKRPPAPTTKVRENQAVRRTRRATRAESPPPFQFQDVEDSDDDYEEEKRTHRNQPGGAAHTGQGPQKDHRPAKQVDPGGPN